MSVQNVVTSGNLGAEFDLGVIEAEKIRLYLGYGLWREADGEMRSVPHRPEERWAVLVESAPLVEQFGMNLPANITDLEGASGGVVTYDFVTVPGLTAELDTTGYNITTAGQTVGDLLILSSTGLSGVVVTFGEPLMIDSFTFTLGGSTDLTVTSLNGEALDIVSSTFESSSGSGTAVLTGTATTTATHTMTISSMGMVDALLIEAQNNGGGTATNAAVRLGSMTFRTVSTGDVYTVQRFADGSLVAVQDGDPTQILTDLSTLMVLDDAPLNNFHAMTVPTVSNDESEGYGRGSRWNDGTNEYVCMDGAVGAAVWRQVTLV